MCAKCDLPFNTILIVNQGNKRLRFEVKPREGNNWSNFALSSAKSVEIACSGCKTRISEFVIRMSTDNREVRYTLDVQKRYTLGWNRNKNLWDVYKAK